jgi:hypothetical protein
MTTTTFDSTKRRLFDILKEIDTGDLQLPDFQRGWIWDDERIKGLLASVSRSFPIGAVMFLQTGNANVRFKPRPVSGAHPNPHPDPKLLILDGQQRLTSLYLALADKVVTTRNVHRNEIKRWYYIDMVKALDPAVDREDAIQSLPENKILGRETDLSQTDEEYRLGWFPFSRIRNAAEWRRGYNKFHNHDEKKTKLFDDFEEHVIKRFEGYDLPVITLDNRTTKEAVCLVFEKVNTGGVALTVFELLTATYAADDFDLRKDWESRRSRFAESPVLKNVYSPNFLQTVALLSTFDKKGTVGCKRRDILELLVEDYQQHAEAATQGYERVARLLHSQNIFSDRDLPYQTQLAPFAAIMAVLGDEGNTDGAKQKLLRWYWCGVLGELYGSAVESRFARDLPEVIRWLQQGGEEPSTIRDANFAPNRLNTLRTRTSAAYKGIFALLMRDGARDLRTGETYNDQIYFDEQIDIHHIFPRKWCDANKISKSNYDYDSIVNKTPLSAKTNRIIGGNAPSDYLRKLQQQDGRGLERMNDLLASHMVEPTALRKDDFGWFFNMRRAALLRRIEEAMGKKVLMDSGVSDD